jgi:serine/threonine protein kinase
MIHSLGYIHRDLKPENIIFQFGIAKICDLGWAADCGFNEMRKSYCGTPLYLPPEMIRKE